MWDRAVSAQSAAAEPSRVVAATRRRRPWFAVLLLSILFLQAICLSGSLRAEGRGIPLSFTEPGNSAVSPSGWILTSGQAVFDQERVELCGGSMLAYRDFTFDDCIVELEYCLLGTGDAQPVLRVRNDGCPRLSGPAIAVDPVSSPPRHAGSVARRRRSGLRTAVGIWHKLRVECLGDCVTLYRDTVPVGSYRIEAGRGVLALEARGSSCGTVAFRHVVVTETTHQPMLDGSSLDGWVGGGGDAAACWEIHDGLLQCTGASGPWLRSAGQHGDFNLRLQYKLREGGNSGVYVRVPEDGRHHGAGAGLEVQILDDAAPRYGDLKPYQFSGSLYAIAAAAPGSARPAGQWNSLEINCRGTHYRVVQNGQVVIDTTDAMYPDLGERLQRGYLGLQNHSETVWFRQIRLGPAR